jgi:hypothetical protein
VEAVIADDKRGPIDAHAAGPGAARSALDEVQAQAEKYRRLVALADAAPGRTEGRRAAMRAIAARFPGALREWDRVPMAELSRRREAAEALLAASARGDGTARAALAEPALLWLRCAIGVQRGLVEALAARRLLADGATFDEAARAIGVPRGRVESFAHPPAGRLSRMAIEETAQAEGITVEALEHALFGDRDDGAR